MAFTRDDNNKTKLNVERANESLSYMLNVQEMVHIQNL